MPDRLQRRVGLIVLLLGACALGLAVRLFFVQVVHGAEYVEKGRALRFQEVELSPAPRGEILDRNGLLLAGNEERYVILASPLHIEDVDEVARQVAPILHLSPTALAAYLRSGEEGKALATDATPEQAKAVEALGFEGISPRLWWARTYPQRDLTAVVIGFATRSGQGYYGLEGFYDDVLRPVNAVWRGELDGRTGQPLPLEERGTNLPAPGERLELTLDVGMQAVVVEELARGMQEFGAEKGIAIVMDPRTGAILAMADLPSYDPHRYQEVLGDEQRLVNDAISLPYEPGSVFKCVTVAAALDSGTVLPGTTYWDSGSIECGGVVVYNWDRRAYGQQDIAGILIRSLNVGATWLTCRQMGADVFYRYVRAFGFGRPTGVDLEGEIGGEVHFPTDLDWHDAYLATNGFGQGIGVTPLQMVSAVAAIANEGRLMRPYLVARRVRPDGTVLERGPAERGRPISPSTARILTDMLVRVVEEGVPLAQVPGYRVAGKTGTAQIPVPGGYSDETIASFVGFGPVPDPRLVILVRLDRPTVSPWGSQTASVVFSRMAARLFPMVGVAPEGMGTE